MSHAPCWRKECRNEPCVRMRLRYKKGWKYAKHRGLTLLVDAAPVRDHIITCVRVGMDAAQISRVTGIPQATINRIKGGDYQRCKKANADAILAIRPDPWSGAEPGTLVPRVGARRRLQALMAIGHSINRLSEERGIQYSVLVYRASASDTMTYKNHLAVADLYDELCMTTGTSARSRSDARRRGYAPPLAWDDDTIDDPNAKPAGMKYMYADMRSRLPDADILVAEVNGSGVTIVAERYGVTPGAINKVLARRGYRAVTRADQRQLPTYMKKVAA